LITGHSFGHAVSCSKIQTIYLNILNLSAPINYWFGWSV